MNKAKVGFFKAQSFGDDIILFDENNKKIKDGIIDFIENVFEPSKMQAYYAEMQGIISSSVSAETSDYSFLNSYGDFTSAISTLDAHVETRVTTAGDYAY